MIKVTIFFILFSWFTAESLFSAEVKRSKDFYTVKLESIDLPKKSLNQKFKSGLKTDIIYTLSLSAGAKKLALYNGYLRIRYDLWEERYLLHRRTGEVKYFSSLSDVYKVLEDLEVQIQLNDLRALGVETFKIQTVFIFNPIGKEKSKKIKEWIAGRSVGKSQGGISGAGFNGKVSVFSGIVNRVVMIDLDKEIYGAEEKLTYMSPEIKIRESIESR